MSEVKDIATRLEGIIQTAIDGIITIDTKGIIETINPAGATLFEYRPEEIIGKNIKVLMPPPDSIRHDQYIKRYLKTKEPRIIGIGREVTGLKKSGDIFPFRLAVSEVILNDRIIFTGIVHDLTKIKEAEEQLRIANDNLEFEVEVRTQELEDVVNELLKSNRKLEESQLELEIALQKEKDLNELKSRFVSMASHEFRTPLSTIMSSASLISRYKDESEDDKRQKHIERIKSAVVNLTGILNDFLSLSKLEEGKVKVQISPVAVSELCEEIVSELQGIMKPGQTIAKCIEGDERIIHTESRILKNTLFNLISNAIKYSGEDCTIHCRITYQDQHIQFEVRDEGIGIPESEQQYLFERFFRASNVETIQGTGLGLNIVKRYVDLLKGSISFVSTEGKGSTFTLIIPYQL